MSLFLVNAVTCPSCGHDFENNKINGLSLVATVSDIDARKRTRTRQLLDDMEKLNLTEPEYRAARKLILDSINDFNRDIQIILGLGEDLE